MNSLILYKADLTPMNISYIFHTLSEQFPTAFIKVEDGGEAEIRLHAGWSHIVSHDAEAIFIRNHVSYEVYTVVQAIAALAEGEMQCTSTAYTYDFALSYISSYEDFLAAIDEERFDTSH